MSEIKLTVDDSKLETLLTILNSLKTDIISDIQVTKSSKKTRTTHYQPPTSKVILEEESGTHDTSGKYASAAAYKQRLNKIKNR